MGPYQMKETRNLLRNVLPAAIFYLYTGLTVLLMTDSIVFSVDSAEVFSPKDLIIGVVAFLTLISPAIGHSLSTIHHFFYNMESCCNPYPRVTHNDLFQRWESVIKPFVPEQFRTKMKSNKWSTVNFLWHAFMDTKEQDIALENRNNLLSHITHSTGSIFIAAFFAPWVALFFLTQESALNPFHWNPQSCSSFVYFLAGWFLLSTFHYIGYRKAVQKQEFFVNVALLHKLQELPKSSTEGPHVA